MHRYVMYLRFYPHYAFLAWLSLPLTVYLCAECATTWLWVFVVLLLECIVLIYLVTVPVVRCGLILALAEMEERRSWTDKLARDETATRRSLRVKKDL